MVEDSYVEGARPGPLGGESAVTAVASERRVHVINLNEGLYWGDCPMCGHYRRLDHAVGWYCGPVKEDIGQPVAEWGGEIAGGMSACRVCHDTHYGEATRNQKPDDKETPAPRPPHQNQEQPG